MSLKSYFIFLSRNKAYTAINVFGLSLSMMFVILIGVYTWQEYHVNSQYPKADRLLVYGMDMSQDGAVERSSGGHWRLQKYFKSRYPEIESSCAIYGGKGIYEGSFLDKGHQAHSYPMLFVDSTFFSLLDIPMVLGDARTALADRNSAVVTDDFARRIFGSPQRAMGKRLEWVGNSRFRITGVIAPIGHSSIRQADIIVRFEHMTSVNPAQTSEGLNNATGTELLFLQRKGAHLEDKTADMDSYQRQFFWIFKPDMSISVHTSLTPFSKYYFTKFDGVASFRLGDPTLVNVLFVVGLVILLFAVFNYVNLTNAISDRRAREMAMRRLVGARGRDVVWRLIAESMLLCGVSMVLAIVLSWVAAPYAAQLLDTDLDLSLICSPLAVLAIVLFTVVLGIIAGMLPAAVISRAKPINIVRGTFHFRTRGWWGKSFIVVQNTATIVLIAMAFGMSRQIHHMITADRGFNTKDIVYVPIQADHKNVDAWYDGLRQLPQVVDAAACAGTPYDGGNNNTFTYGKKSISLQTIYGDKHFMKLFGLKATHLTGLKDSLGGDEYVNRQLLAEEGLPLNSRFYYVNSNRRENVSGVLSDFTIRTLDSEQHPLSVVIYNDSLRYEQWGTAIQVQGDPVTAYESILRLFKKIFHGDLELDTPYLDQQIARDYQSETRVATILKLFSAIAVVISMLGLIAMSTYYIESRRREIAVRKVFGSTSGEVSRRFIRQFMSYVGLAFIIAVPLYLWQMGSWISQYNHRIVWWPWILVSATIVFLVSYAAVAIQTWKAARGNPAENIQQE